jgi:periplasmic divalent cation tolerance protein
MKPLVAFTTVGDIDTARRLARTLVERKLAACAQLSSIESFYVWDGALQQSPEVRIVLKTTDAAWPALERAIAELHPYELPAIHAIEVAAIHAPYAVWIAAGTQA